MPAIDHAGGPAWPRWVACAASIVVLLIGGLAVVGVPVLRSLVPGWTQMAISTALCFILGGVAVFLADAALRADPARAAILRRIARVCGCCMLAIGGVTLGADIGGWDISLDGAWLPLTDPSAVRARMSAATALDFVILGCAVMLIHGKRCILSFQWLALAGGLIGWMGVTRYIYGGESLSFLVDMSLNSSLAFIAMSAGLLCTRTNGGVMELVCASTQGGAMIRGLLPYAIAVPLVTGWIRLQGQRAGWYGTEAGLSLFTVINVTGFGILAWITARRLHRTDTERKRHEVQALHLAAVVHSSDDAIVGKTLDGIITTWNVGAERVFGFSAEDAIGKPMLMLMPPDQGSDDAAILRTIAAGKTVEQRKAVRVHQDGRSIDVSIAVSPIRDPSGTVVGASVIARDISEQKLADAKLHEHLARLDLLRQVTKAISEHQDLASIYQVVIRCLEEQMPIDFACVCMYDPNAQTLTVSRVGVNSAALAMELALTEQTVIAIDRNGLSRCVQGELVYEPDISTIDFPFPRRLANAGLRSLVATPLQVDSLVVGVILAARRQPDAFSSGECEFLNQLSAHVALATRHAELYTALQQAYNDLRQTQQTVMQNERLRALGQMASGIAHDINNALTPVIMYAERMLMKETQISEQSRKWLQIIMRAGEDVSATVGRLREFYRQQDQRAQVTGTDLNVLIQHVIDLTQAQWKDVAQQRGIAIEVQADLATDIPFVVGVDSELRQALTNLVLNAIDALPTGGLITLRTRLIETNISRDGMPSGRVVRLEVADTGRGMDEQVRQHCLEPFFTTKGERGTGLGLAMVYGIVQRHAADITVDSVVGQGSTFRIDFHKLSNTSTPTTQDVADLPSRLHLLLIDDDPIVLNALNDALVDDGHELVMANGGQAGINAFQAAVTAGQTFDAVITDLGMPSVDGRRVAAAVKTCSISTPVILLTGWGQGLSESGQSIANVDRILSKPPKIREIRTALKQLTRNN